MKTAIHAKDAHSKSDSPRSAARSNSASPSPLLQLTDRLGNRGMQRFRPIQRKCACGGTCSSCREDEDLKLQRKSTGQPPLSHGVALAHDLASQPGQPLEPSLRSDMESRFGADFSPVRIHNDPSAATASRALHAEAFTTGNHIAFAPGRFGNDTQSRELLAHELNHVIQQSQGRVAPGSIDSGPSDPLEMESAAKSRTPAPLQSPSAGAKALSIASPAAVQRQEEESPASAAEPAAAEPAAAPTASTESPQSGSSDLVEGALVGISAAGRFFPMLAPLTDAVVMIRGLVYVWEHRAELQQQLIAAIGGYIATVPALALSKLGEYVESLGPAAAEAFSCVWGQAQAFLDSLAENWLSLLGEFFTDMIFIWRPIGRAVDVIVDNLDGILDDIANFNFSSLSHRVVAIMTEVNSVIGIFFLWYALITTLGGAIAGSEVPAAGNAAGGALGATVAEIVGVVLITSVLATESLRVINGIADMTENWDDPLGRQAGCREIAEGVFGIAVTLALFFLGPRIQGFFRSVIQRSRVIFQDVSQAMQRVAARAATPRLALAGGPSSVQLRGPLPQGPIPEIGIPGARPGTGTGLPARGTGVVVQPIVEPTVPSTVPQPAAAPQLGLGPGVAGAVGAQVAEHPPDCCELPTGLTRTAADAIPMIWFKHPIHYPEEISIDHLGDHLVYPMYGESHLPRGERIGVDEEFRPGVGKFMQLVPERREGSPQRDFRQVLRSYGFDWGGFRYLQADHVQDVMWDGADAFRNLWPMDGAANMSAGSRQNIWQRISFAERRCAPTSQCHYNITMMQMRRLGFSGRWFIIRSVDI